MGVIYEERDTSVNLKKMMKARRPCIVVSAIEEDAGALQWWMNMFVLGHKYGEKNLQLGKKQCSII